MTRIVKVLGIVPVVVLALSVVAVSGVFAQFESESAPVQITRSSNTTQVYKYTSSGPTMECKTVVAEGTMSSSPATEIKLSPALSECVSSLGGPIDIFSNGCTWIITLPAKSTNATEHWQCPFGKEVETTFTDNAKNSICTIFHKGQTPSGTITGSNVGSGATREIKLSFALTGIVSRRVGSVLCGPAESTTGTYSGEITFKGENPLTHAQIGIFLD